MLEVTLFACERNQGALLLLLDWSLFINHFVDFINYSIENCNIRIYSGSCILY